MLPLAKIDWDALLELVWAAPLAGLTVSLAFSLVILGASRAGDARRQGADGVAFGFAALAIASGLASAAIVAYGLSLIIT